MQIDMDISEVTELSRKARRVFRRIPRSMLRIGQFAAQFERATHPYQNRTGMLEASTRAFIAEGADVVTLSLVMAMPYASHVDRLGYSHVGEAAALIDRQLQAGFDAMARDLSDG